MYLQNRPGQTNTNGFSILLHNYASCLTWRNHVTCRKQFSAPAQLATDFSAEFHQGSQFVKAATMILQY